MTDFKAKMHQIRFRLGLRPRPRWGSLQRSPDPLAGFGGRFAAGGGTGLGKRRESGGGREEGEVEGREREGTKLLLNQSHSDLLRHCLTTERARFARSHTNNVHPRGLYPRLAEGLSTPGS